MDVDEDLSSDEEDEMIIQPGPIPRLVVEDVTDKEVCMFDKIKAWIVSDLFIS
jgi:hypothetical protein